MLVMAPVAAFAEIGDKGSPAPLSDIEKVGFFVVIPVALLVALLVVYYRPGSGGSSRYRPLLADGVGGGDLEGYCQRSHSR